jgi:putative transposase
MAVLTGIQNRGTRGVYFLVCDGLKGPPEVPSRPLKDWVS